MSQELVWQKKMSFGTFVIRLDQDELARRCAASSRAAGKPLVVVLNVGSPKASWPCQMMQHGMFGFGMFGSLL